jgi:phosphotransacetylase
MKGSLHTDEVVREVTASKTGLRTARRISHVFIMDVPTYSETLFVTDAAINIFPDLDANVTSFRTLSICSPKLGSASHVWRFCPQLRR